MGTGCAKIIEKSLKNEVEKILLEISARHDVAGYVKWVLTQLRFRVIFTVLGLSAKKSHGTDLHLKE